MKSLPAVLLLVAAVCEVALVAAVVMGQYQLALEIIACGSLFLWAVLAFFGKDLLAARRDSEHDRYMAHVAGRYARYGVRRAPVMRKRALSTPVLLPVVLATIAGASVTGAAAGFVMAGDVAMASAVCCAAALGALAVYCGQPRRGGEASAQRPSLRPLFRRR